MQSHNYFIWLSLSFLNVVAYIVRISRCHSAMTVTGPSQESLEAGLLPVLPNTSSSSSSEQKHELHPLLKSPAPTGAFYLALDIFQFGSIIASFILPGIVADSNLSAGFIASISILAFEQAVHYYLTGRGLRQVWPIRLNLFFATMFTALLVGSYTASTFTYRWYQVIQNAASALFCVITIAVGNPMIADFGRDEAHEVLWDHWAFRTICLRLTWAWAAVFAFMAACSGVAMAITADWSNILFNYVLQISVTLVCIKLSYSYPDQYKRRHQQRILASLPPELVAANEPEASEGGAAAGPCTCTDAAAEAGQAGRQQQAAGEGRQAAGNHG